MQQWGTRLPEVRLQSRAPQHAHLLLCRRDQRVHDSVDERPQSGHHPSRKRRVSRLTCFLSVDLFILFITSAACWLSAYLHRFALVAVQWIIVIFHLNLALVLFIWFLFPPTSFLVSFVLLNFNFSLAITSTFISMFDSQSVHLHYAYDLSKLSIRSFHLNVKLNAVFRQVHVCGCVSSRTALNRDIFLFKWVNLQLVFLWVVQYKKRVFSDCFVKKVWWRKEWPIWLGGTCVP